MRTDIAKGRNVVKATHKQRFFVEKNQTPQFEVIDDNGKPVAPDIFDILMTYIKQTPNLSNAKLAEMFSRVAWREMAFSNVTGVDEKSVYAIMNALIKGSKDKAENKDWRLNGRTPIKVGDMYIEHHLGLRQVVIGFDPASHEMTLMPDWATGEKMFRHYIAGGIATPKAEVWRKNMAYNEEKTGLKKGIKSLVGMGKGKVGIICGNGPSLNRNGELLKKHPNAIVLGCNQSLEMFQDYSDKYDPNAMFDIYGIVDHNSTEKTKNWLFNKEGKPREFDGTVIGAVTCLNHYVDAFGERIHWFTGSDVIGGMAETFAKGKWTKRSLSKWLKENDYKWTDVVEFADHWKVMVEAKHARRLGWVADSRSVILYLAHFAFWTLGCDSIVLTGCDFSSSPDGMWTPVTQMSWVQDQYATPDMYGNTVITRPSYNQARLQTEFAAVFLTNCGVPLINATEGGILNWPVRMSLKRVYEYLDKGPGELRSYVVPRIEKMFQGSDLVDASALTEMPSGEMPDA